ncbi:uncharacterized protein TNCV_3967441 [Trichonephila clavipes]|nr:uncharacterized protein TNCV_3967441 [Trichonephila clavipes]
MGVGLGDLVVAYPPCKLKIAVSFQAGVDRLLRCENRRRLNDLARFHLNFDGERPEGGQGPPTFLLFPLTSREDLRLDGYLKYPHAAKALYIYKHPCLLRDLNTGPTAKQSASLTTIPDG